MARDIPIGMITSFFGDATSEGAPTTGIWELCDGRTLQISDYAELYAIIGLTYGGDESKGEFKVPDYRGRFLRGTDYAQKVDTGAATRTSAGALAAGPQIGSVQGYATRLPRASFSLSLQRLPNEEARIAATAIGHDLAKRNSDSVVREITGGDKESRPVNVYCNFYIKARRAAA